MAHVREPVFGWRWVAGVAFSSGLGLLIFLSVFQVREAQRELRLTPAPTQQPNWPEGFHSRIELVTERLAQLQLPLPPPTLQPQGSRALRWQHRHYEIVLPAPKDPQAIAELLEPVQDAAPGVTVHVNQETNGAQAQVAVDGLLTHTVAMRWLGRRPRAAILIEDLGNDLLIARRLVDIDAPLTLAVLPFRPFSSEIAELAALLGREVWLHLPLVEERHEGLEVPALRASASRAEIQQTLAEAVVSVPHAAGVATRIGALLGDNPQRLQWILAPLQQRRLSVIETRVDTQTATCEAAAALSLPCLPVSLSLDDVDEEQAIRIQLATLVQLAHTRGDVIAVGRARPSTRVLLQDAVPEFAAANIDIVPASLIIAERSLSGR